MADLTKRSIARQTARSQNARYYFTGEPCRAGHVAERYTSTAACVECVLLFKKAQTLKKLGAERYADASGR